ncbi:MAG: Bax inhibitor-1 family protein [Rickettsiales bacterium]|nr:Bax inhibitor-1 family protein [Rickettsiales bacterium]
MKNQGISLGSAVWERGGASEISRNQFVLLMGFFTFLGLGLTAVLAYFTTGWMHIVPAVEEGGKATYAWAGPINFWLFWVGVLVTSIIGIFIALGSDKPAVSLIGYALVAGPFGLLLGPVVGMYTAMSIVKVIIVTGGVTGVLTLIGAIIPESLENWGGWLFGGLLILLFGSLGVPLLGLLIPGFPVQGALTFLDWVGVFLFSAYIIFDMNRAMRVPATVDNAIDCALALYLDIINLFIRLLEIMGQKKD